MRGRSANILAVLVLVALALTSIAVYTFHSYTTLQTTASGQQVFSQADQAASESIQAAVYRLMQRGYNNTAEMDAGELWYCNAPLPPNLEEIDGSLQLLVEEEIQRLMQQFGTRGISASTPSITSFTAETIDDLPDDQVRILIKDFVITHTTDDGEQSILLDGEETYDMPTWGMFKALDEWARCDAGNLTEELRAVLDDGECLFDSCCCEAEYSLEDEGDYLLELHGIQTSDLGLEQAVNRSVQRLQALLNGAPSCEDTEGYEDLPNSIVCEATVQLTTDNVVHYSTVPGVCQGEYNCLFRGLGSPTQPYAWGAEVQNYCRTHREPQSGGIGTEVNPPNTSVPTLGGDVNYNRVAIDKYVGADVTVRCTDQDTLVFVDNEFRPLQATVQAITSLHNACDTETDSGREEVDYTYAVCLTAGGGSECLECTGACENIPETMCNADGHIFAPVCDSEGVFQNSCAYQPCEELFCSPGVPCCDDTVQPVQFSCQEGVGCVPQTPAQACEEHGGVVGVDCTGGGLGEGDDEGDDEGDEEDDVCEVSADCTGVLGACQQWECNEGVCERVAAHEGDVCEEQLRGCMEVTYTCQSGSCVRAEENPLPDGTPCLTGRACSMHCVDGACELRDSSETCTVLHRCGSEPPQSETGSCRSDGTCSISGSQNTNRGCPGSQICCDFVGAFCSDPPCPGGGT